MFSIQQNFAQATEPCLKDRFYAVVRSQAVNDIIRECRRAVAAGDKQAYNRAKRRLPGFIFMAEVMDNEGPDSKGNPLPRARWRKQAACRLNGLVMVDFDHVHKRDGSFCVLFQIFLMMPSLTPVILLI